MDNTEFEKYFMVVSADEDGARYFLTPRFMERLLKLNKETNVTGIYLKTLGNTIYLAKQWAPSLKEGFEFGKFQVKISKKRIISQLKKDLNETEQVIQTIKSLNLPDHHIHIHQDE